VNWSKSAFLVALIAMLLVVASTSSALNAAVAWRVNHAEKTISVTAYIAVYMVPAPENGLQVQRYLEAIAAIERDIEREWNGKKFKCYDFVVDVRIRAASGPSDVRPTEFPVRLDQSLVPRSSGVGMEHVRSHVSVPGYNSSNYLSDDPQWDPRTGPTDTPSNWELTSSPGVYAHEFGHLLGLDDNYVEGTGALRPGAADDIMRMYTRDVSEQTIVKAIRRSGEVDESLIKCPLDLTLERTEQNLILLTLELEVTGCAPDYEPSSTDPNRPGQVTFSGEVLYSGSYLESFPEIPFRVTERGGVLPFVSTWRQPELDVAVSLEAGGQLRQGVFTRRVPLVSRPSPVTLHNSRGQLATGNIMQITPRDTPCP
jgi:hypothetical protein